MAYDDIINKYKKHLTKAQIKALADMEQKYRNLYSQQRAQALNEMTAQGNSMQRALQNMGLAGRHGKLISGVQKAGNERLTRSYGDYHTQLGRAQNAQLERAAIRMANQTIAAQNAAAQAAYHQQLAQQQAQQKLIYTMMKPIILFFKLGEYLMDALPEDRQEPMDIS